jgi:LCP family protein required for cell wall assembly
LINPRLAKASLISIPSNLYVYIPGYTMQRINAAYALGGIKLLGETFAYNFGLKPSRFVLAHPEDFALLVDDVGGVGVSVLYPLPDACGGIPSGLQTMKGSRALCYVSYQDGTDEIDRLVRQQQLLRLVFNKMVKNGNLAKLPQLYVSYKDLIETDFSLVELASYIPLALKLGDPARVKYFIIDWEAISLWELPDESQTQVFLPDHEVVADIIQTALDEVMQSSPLSEIVLTYEAQLTEVISQTMITAPSMTATPVLTQGTPVKTSTPVSQPTSTSVIKLTSTQTVKPTASATVQPSQTKTVQPTPTQPLYPIVTPTQSKTTTLYP